MAEGDAAPHRAQLPRTFTHTGELMLFGYDFDTFIAAGSALLKVLSAAVALFELF